ncbi:hypothetical protein AB0O18_05755 [Streptomyces sp. NPDC093224]|uniref:hypothetical protein n=1 Tax=Streptomyces sp. NPDC093224 TaxID=3155198 RepID=UPI00343B25D8
MRHRPRSPRLLALLTLLFGVLALAPGSPAWGRTAGLGGTWSCTVPAGYVWDSISNGCSNSIQYRLQTPADGKWSCKVPDAWTYDAIDDTLSGEPYGPCQLGASKGKATRLAAPVDGRWVCELPRQGVWTYDRISSSPVLSGCSVYGGNFYLRKPVTGLWACTVPAGFTRAQTSGSTTTCRGPQYLLRQL